MEALLIILGLAIIGCMIKFFTLQNVKYDDRTKFGKFVTWVAILETVALIINLM